MANRLFVNNGNGRKARATKAVFDGADRAADLQLDGRHGEGRPRRPPTPTSARASTTTCSASAAARTRWRSTPAPRSAPSSRCSTPANDPNIELGVAPLPGPAPGDRGGVFNQGGELFMVNKSAPAKQAAAWKFLKFLAEPENVTDLGHRHRLHPDPRVVGRQHRDAGLLGAEPGLQGRLRPVARRPRHRRHRGIGDRRTTRARATRSATR